MRYSASGSLSKALADFIKDNCPEVRAEKILQEGLPGGIQPARILCLGKAASGLARAAARLWPGVPGLSYGVTAKDPVPRTFRALYGDHPFPTEANVQRTEEVEAWLEGTDGPLLACISGGGSSLLVHPRPPWRLEEKALVTEALWRGGASIGELNVVRSRLSMVKAGGLRKLAGRGPVVTAIWSDVGPRDWRMVSSGPTLRWRRKLEAEEVLAKYGVKPPRPLPPPEWGRTFLGDSCLVLDDAVRLRMACAHWLEGQGYDVRVMAAGEGEAADSLAARMGRWLRRSSRISPVACVGSGEVVVAAAKGQGRGGRCSHLAAELALDLASHPPPRPWAFTALATDGVDGTAGAGAFVDSDGVPPVEDLRRSIARRDTGRLWRDHQGLVPRGATGNNLRDLWVLVGA
jgi:glycerate 2-kinase